MSYDLIEHTMEVPDGLRSTTLKLLCEQSSAIGQLEDALEISHSANSTSHHPLLREELLAIKRGVGPTTTPANEQETDGPEGSCVEALGTMSISDRGVSRFIGRSGGGESLILVS